MAAGQEDEPVSDSGPRPGYSAFTGALLDILEGSKDLDGDGILTASEIGAYVQKQVFQHSSTFHQRPIFMNILGSEGGDFVFKVFNTSDVSNNERQPNKLIDAARQNNSSELDDQEIPTL